MSSYANRLENERIIRAKEQQAQVNWYIETEAKQKARQKMNRYSIDMDGFSFVRSPFVEALFVGDYLLIEDGYGEQTIQKISSIRQTDGREALEGKKVKATSPVETETKNKYTIQGVPCYFENKLSKNQLILVNNRLFVVEQFEKETDTLHLKKELLKKVVAQYAVYNQQASRSPEYFFEKWGDAFGMVCKKRSEGNYWYSL